jgi:hypothetical protein
MQLTPCGLGKPQVRRGIAAAAAAAAAAKQRLGAATGKDGGWATLPAAALQAKLEAAGARRRALAQEMPPAQWQLEEQ